MAIFYFLHHVLPSTDIFKEGKRNCATFLFGAFLYAVVYVIIKNFQLKYGKYIDAFLSAFLIILIADMCTMAYIYKSYYGRNILYELKDENQEDWVFDEKTHKYVKPTDSQKIYTKLKEKKKKIKIQQMYEDEIADLKDKLASQKRIKDILEKKKHIKAAKVIQRWWRSKLYNPPDGIFYVRSLKSFEANLKNN
jgi:hypothetical protein